MNQEREKIILTLEYYVHMGYVGCSKTKNVHRY